MNYLYGIILGYFIGAIPFSLLITKALSDKDIRKEGSGNIGTTNVLRTVGLKVGLIAFLGDFLKGVIPALIAMYVWNYEVALLTGLASMIGHSFPIYLKFKGGKGVATSAGALAVLAPMWLAIALVIQFSILFTTKLMGLSSVVSALSTAIYGFVFMDTLIGKISIGAIGLIVLVRHHANIGRLIRGEEKKLVIKKKSQE